MKLSNVLTQEFSQAGGVDSLAELLNRAGRSTERTVLEAIAETDGELADEIRQKLFTFDDIVVLTDRDIQLLLREVDQKDLGLALRGVTEEVKDTIFRNMSTRGAEMLQEDLDTASRSAGRSSRRPRAASSAPSAASRTPAPSRIGRGGEDGEPPRTTSSDGGLRASRPGGRRPACTPYAAPAPRAEPRDRPGQPRPRRARRRPRGGLPGRPARGPGAAGRGRRGAGRARRRRGRRRARARRRAPSRPPPSSWGCASPSRRWAPPSTSGPERVVDVVRGALRRLVERDRVTILVNPEDLDLVRGASDALMAELGGIEHCDVQAERRVARGGAIVRTVEGEVDATLDDQARPRRARSSDEELRA